MANSSFTDLAVLFPFLVPVYIPRSLSNAVVDTLSALRIVPSRQDRSRHGSNVRQNEDDRNGPVKPYVRLSFPMNFVTAPIIADLFLLAILAIGRQELHDGTVGGDNISPFDIMAFFLTLAYIAISIDASGLIRYLAFKVLQKGGKGGHRLFLYIYLFVFGLGSFIGNDPIILSGTAFLAYMTRVSSNILHPRAWIHTQFAVANIASAILVSSNPANLVLAGAFDVKFVTYTANVIVPVIVTAIVLFPFLLYYVFADERLIPPSIKMHELSEEARAKKPVNPNIPHARGNAEEKEREPSKNEESNLSLSEIMNPFLDKGGAAFGAVIMAMTLITVLVLNATSQSSGGYPVYWITLPAAFVMFCWDLGSGWRYRHQTREIARKGREEIERARAERLLKEREGRRRAPQQEGKTCPAANESDLTQEPTSEHQQQSQSPTGERLSQSLPNQDDEITLEAEKSGGELEGKKTTFCEQQGDLEKQISHEISLRQERGPPTLVSLLADAHRWSQETFPTVTTVLTLLPFKLVPFALSMFVLVQALVTKGWVPVFAYGWDHWVNKTGTVGSIGGMGFLSVILCNVSVP